MIISQVDFLIRQPNRKKIIGNPLNRMNLSLNGTGQIRRTQLKKAD